MADPTLVQAISLLTKVSADTSKRLAALESAGGGAPGRAAGPRKVKEKPQDVVVQDFGKKAEKDLSGLGGGDGGDGGSGGGPGGQTNKDLLKLLGLAGAAALALKFLFEGEGFTGLVQGFQSAVKKVTTFAGKCKSAVSKIGEKIGTFADDVATKTKGVVDDITKKAGKFGDDVANGLKKIGVKGNQIIDDLTGINIKESMDDLGKKVSSFTDDVIKGFKNVASKINPFKAQVDDMAKGIKPPAGGGGGGAGSVADDVVPPKQGFFSKAGNFLKKAGGKIKQVGGSVINWTKDKIMKPVKTGISKVKPVKMLKGLLKSPLLAPILESFFTYKDVNDMISQFIAGEIDEKTLNQQVGTRMIEAVTGVIGGAGGAILGSALGSVIPVAGNIIGAIIGGVLGDVAGRGIGKLIAGALGPKTGEVGSFALTSPLFAGGMEGEKIEDGIITKQGDLIQPSPDDTLYAMKQGGPLADIFTKGLVEQTGVLKKLTDVSGNMLNRQVELLEKNNMLMEAFLENGNKPVVVNNVSKSDVRMEGSSLRSLQDQYSY